MYHRPIDPKHLSDRNGNIGASQSTSETTDDLDASPAAKRYPSRRPLIKLYMYDHVKSPLSVSRSLRMSSLETIQLCHFDHCYR